jgi:hypothetical protein
VAAIHQIVRVIKALNDEDRALVLAFANALLDREMLRLPSSEPRDEAEWRAWVGRVQARGVLVLARELARLQAAGLANETGPLPRSSCR